MSSYFLIVVALVLRFADVPCNEESSKQTGYAISRCRVDFAEVDFSPPAAEFGRSLELVMVSILLSFEVLRLTISLIDAVLVPVLLLPSHPRQVSPAHARPLLVLIIVVSSFRRRSDKWR